MADEIIPCRFLLRGLLRPGRSFLGIGGDLDCGRGRPLFRPNAVRRRGARFNRRKQSRHGIRGLPCLPTWAPNQVISCDNAFSRGVGQNRKLIRAILFPVTRQVPNGDAIRIPCPHLIPRSNSSPILLTLVAESHLDYGIFRADVARYLLSLSDHKGRPLMRRPFAVSEFALNARGPRRHCRSWLTSSSSRSRCP